MHEDFFFWVIYEKRKLCRWTFCVTLLWDFCTCDICKEEGNSKIISCVIIHDDDRHVSIKAQPVTRILSSAAPSRLHSLKKMKLSPSLSHEPLNHRFHPLIYIFPRDKSRIFITPTFSRSFLNSYDRPSNVFQLNSIIIVPRKSAIPRNSFQDTFIWVAP